jgi:hypothetical protein
MQHNQPIIVECPECGLEILVHMPPCACPLCFAMESKQCMCDICGVDKCKKECMRGLK